MRTMRAVLFVLALAPSLLRAQDGPGTAGAGVLQLMAGSRAPALSGAYAAMAGDADVLFYNPAGIAALRAGASVAYQRYVEDIGLFSGAGAARAGRVVLGASLLVLDYGTIAEIVPDPDFGGQTGTPTGNRVGASELAARVSAGMPLLDDRLRLGVSAGVVRVELAGGARVAPLFDAGAQLQLPHVTLGAALRNLGTKLSGRGLADAPLPRELRLGASAALPATGRLGALVAADFVAALEEGTSGFVAGIEAGLLPSEASPLGAVVRVGYDGAVGDGGIGAVRAGGGLSAGAFSLDYTYQNFDPFGAVHRFGVRWAIHP